MKYVFDGKCLKGEDDAVIGVVQTTGDGEHYVPYYFSEKEGVSQPIYLPSLMVSSVEEAIDAIIEQNGENPSKAEIEYVYG